MIRSNLRYLVFACSVLLFSPAAHGQFEYYQSEWKTIETEHFYVDYHEGEERTARVVAKVAEEIFEPVTSLYNHKPDQKVSIVLKDYDDYSNGAAYYYDNRIEIYATSMDYDFRGTHNWLRNVVTHEFTHIVQMQTSMKFGRKLPAFYLQWLNYESERRPDVLYGYPNVIVSYPVAGVVAPVWFAEGIAQFNRPELRYDYWDSHRDMILRSYALDGKLLSWNDMGVFGKTSLGNESAYNAGFSLITYIAHVYGEDALNRISRDMASVTDLTIDGAIRQATGKDGEEVYNDWRAAVTKDYEERVAPVRRDLREGQPLILESSPGKHGPAEALPTQTMFSGKLPDALTGRHIDYCCAENNPTGFANLYPVFSPDGKKLAYVSAKGADYMSLSALYVYDVATGKESMVCPGVGTSISWSPDGRRLYYGKLTRSHPQSVRQFDIYEYNLATEDERRITEGRRAYSPAVSPDGATLVFVVNADGTTNLAASKSDGSGFRLLTSFKSGEQVYTPRWSPSGDAILFDYSIKDGRDIGTIRPDGSGLRFLVSGPDDSRSGVYTPDGRRIIFASDRTGIFNLYSCDTSGADVHQISNVLGGAFMPTVDSAGTLIYSAYTSSGYKLYAIRKPGVMAAGEDHYIQRLPFEEIPSGPSLASSAPQTPADQFDWHALRSYDDTKPPAYEPRSYRSTFTSLSFVPFIRVDNYNTSNRALDVVKPGVYLFSNDMLEKMAFFAGAALNRRLERDLFFQFYYLGELPLFHQLGLNPTATAEVYNITRKTGATISFEDSTSVPVDITYDLLEFDFSLTQQFISKFSNIEFRYTHSRYNSSLGDFVLPATGALVPASGNLYLIGNDLSLTFRLDAIVPASTSDINPVGRRLSLRLDRQLNQFNGDNEYEVTSTGLRPKYKTVNFTSAELNWREYVPAPFENHSLLFSLRGGAIFGPSVDDFFDFYAGGIDGMKGYPFYALGGNRIAAAQIGYRFPLATDIDARIGQLSLKNIFASVYAGAGDAWTEARPVLRNVKTDAGMEIRLESFSFYAYPTAIFFDASYGFTRFSKFIQTTNSTVTYGREWRFYFGILFGFDLD